MPQPHNSGQTFRLIVAVLVITLMIIAIQTTVSPSHTATNLVVNPGSEGGISQSSSGGSEQIPGR